MRAMVFDFDGTLVDTEPIHEEALRAAARAHGADVEPGASIGLSDEDAMAQALSYSGVSFDGALIARACREKTAAYMGLIEGVDITVYDGGVELVRAAALRVPVGICTAAMREEVLPVLARIGIEGVIRELVCADDVSAKKPDPAGYVETARRLGVEAGRCVVIEDSVRGVEAARRAGCRVVAVGHTTERERLRDAHVYVARIGEVCLDVLLDGSVGG